MANQPKRWPTWELGRYLGFSDKPQLTCPPHPDFGTKRQPEERGFTLIELLIVSVLLALLASILYGTISGFLRGHQIAESRRETAQTAQYILERITRELTARATVRLSSETTQAEANTNPYSQLQSAFGSYMVITDSKNGDHDSDSIRFVSSNAAQAVFGSFHNYGLVEIIYRIEEQEERRFGSGSPDGIESLILVREEFPADVKETKIIESRRLVFPLADNLVSFNLRHLKNNKWGNEWGQTNMGLPEAIEISLKLRGSSGSIDTYKTAVAISRPTSRR